MSYIYLKGKQWLFEEIFNLKEYELERLTLFENSILTTAKHWLRGKQEFTLQTSGSTGKPKSLTFTRDQIRQSVEQTVNTFSLEKGDVLFNPVSVSSVAGFMMLMRGLVYEMPVYCVEPSRNPISDELLTQKFEFAAFVPLQIQAISEAGKDYQSFLNQMKAIIIGGGPMDPALEKEVEKLQCPVYHTYGMTETLTHVAIRQIAPENWENYKGLKGVRFEQDQKERLIIHTPLWTDPVQTNDRVKLIDEKHFKWLGRADWVINSGGYKIQIETVENKIGKILANYWQHIPEFFLKSQPDKSLGEKVVLFIKTQEPLHQKNKEALLKKMRLSLHSYEIPKQIIDLRNFEYTSTGKINRKKTE